MKQVQRAFESLPIKAHADIWRQLDSSEDDGSQYVVYVTKTIENTHSDDVTTSIKTYVYMNLWSKGNPNTTAAMIRAAMMNAGFAMEEESTGSTSDSRYDEIGRNFCVSWTWVYVEEF